MSSRLRDAISRMRRTLSSLQARLGGREIIIDLRGVSTRDQFQRELASHLPISAERRQLWPSLNHYITIGRGGPVQLRFLGWPEFERRMPRYANRLVRSFAQPRLWKLTAVFD
jgi:hypothetical protein